jgi:hypothetical protein
MSTFCEEIKASLPTPSNEKLIHNSVSIKSACAMGKVLMVHNCDNDILDWRLLTPPPKPKIHWLLVVGIGGYRLCFLLNLQLK